MGGGEKANKAIQARERGQRKPGRDQKGKDGDIMEEGGGPDIMMEWLNINMP